MTDTINRHSASYHLGRKFGQKPGLADMPPDRVWDGFTAFGLPVVERNEVSRRNFIAGVEEVRSEMTFQNAQIDPSTSSEVDEVVTPLENANVNVLSSNAGHPTEQVSEEPGGKS